MNFKYKFDMPAVAAMIAGTFFLVAIGYIMNRFNLPFLTEAGAVVIVIIAALFGPSAGGIAAVAASALYPLMLGVNVDIVHIVAYVLIAIAIGHYAPDFGVREGRFGLDEAVEFFVIHLLIEGLIWMFFIPFVTFLIRKNNLFEMLQTNTNSLIFTVVADVLLIPLFLLISYLSRKWQAHKKNVPAIGLGAR